ncbi:hypothetical protein BKA83DRAFT_680976 [Pisolithus microcarpus]|nr:hypothetical protein BKA83DRAFT_680976 [Pisolithus microcarpus]
MANHTTPHLGPLLVSLVLSGILSGCALVQTYIYLKAVSERQLENQEPGILLMHLV